MAWQTPVYKIMAGELAAVLHDLDDVASLWQAEGRLNWLRGIADDEVSHVVSAVDAAVSAVMEEQWAETPDELARARLARAREYLVRGDYASACAAFWRVPGAKTDADRRALLGLAIDDGDYEQVETLCTELKETVPPGTQLECATVLWRRFRDAVNGGGAASGRNALIAVMHYMECGALDVARQRAYEFLDLLRRHRSWALWDEHHFWLFEALMDAGVTIPDAELREIIDWAVDQLNALELGETAEHDRNGLLAFIRQLTQYQVRMTTHPSVTDF